MWNMLLIDSCPGYCVTIESSNRYNILYLSLGQGTKSRPSSVSGLPGTVGRMVKHRVCFYRNTKSQTVLSEMNRVNVSISML